MMINPFEPLTFTLTSVIVLVLTFAPYVSRVTEWFVTIIHEVGHAVASVITLGGIHSIKLRMNGSGETTTLTSAGFFSWFRRVFVLFSGYSAPIFLGLVLIWGVKQNFTQFMFYLLLATALLTLFFIRNFFGLFIVILYFIFLGLSISIAQSQFLSVSLVGFGLFLTVKGVTDLVIAGKLVFVDKHGGTDFDLLSESTIIRIPAGVWYVVYAIGTVILFMVALFLFWHSTVNAPVAG